MVLWDFMRVQVFIDQTTGGFVEVSVVKLGLSSGAGHKYDAGKAKAVLLAFGFDAGLVDHQLATLSETFPSVLLRFPVTEIADDVTIIQIRGCLVPGCLVHLLSSRITETQLQYVLYRTIASPVSQSGDFVTPSQADRIQELCAQASATNDPKELERLILELQIAIHVHSEKLRIMVAKHRSDLTQLPTKTEKAA